MDPASASALLTDKECLSFFLRLDVSNGNVKHSTTVFGKELILGVPYYLHLLLEVRVKTRLLQQDIVTGGLR